MSKLAFHRRILPAVRLSVDELKAIEQALGVEFSESTEWNFWASHTAVSNKDLDAALEEAQDVRGLTDFEIIADSPDASITISGGTDGCFLEYQHSYALRANVTAKARAIEGIFRGSRRRTAYVPSPVTALPVIKGACRSPAIKIGAPGFRLEIEWSKVAQTVITNWLSHLGTALIAFGIGLAVGWFGS